MEWYVTFEFVLIGRLLILNICHVQWDSLDCFCHFHQENLSFFFLNFFFRLIIYCRLKPRGNETSFIKIVKLTVRVL